MTIPYSNQSPELSTLYNFGPYCSENNESNSFSAVNLLYQCIPCTVTRQWLCKDVLVAMNTHAAIKQLLDVSFSIWYGSYQRKVGD
jgi:hypothetical protein